MTILSQVLLGFAAIALLIFSVRNSSLCSTLVSLVFLV